MSDENIKLRNLCEYVLIEIVKLKHQHRPSAIPLIGYKMPDLPTDREKLSRARVAEENVVSYNKQILTEVTEILDHMDLATSGVTDLQNQIKQGEALIAELKNAEQALAKKLFNNIPVELRDALKNFNNAIKKGGEKIPPTPIPDPGEHSTPPS